jgi:UDP-glucose:(heptosyl)LPS alpha-1,3-glucosyltransferase
MNRPLRVALVYRNFGFGGSLERDVVLLARGLVRREIEVHCYCNPETRTAELEGVEFHDVRPVARSRARLGQPIETLSFAAAATRALRRDRARYDILDVTGVSAWEADVVTVHGVTKALQHRWPDDAGRDFRAARARATISPVLRPQIGVARAIERIQFRSHGFRRAIAVTEQVRRDLIHVHSVPEERIDVVHPPVDLERFSGTDGRAVRAELGLEPADEILLFVGHDFRRKGLADAITALAGLPEDVHLLVVGDGERGPFEAQADGAGLSERVHFAGGTEEPERYFEAADIFVLPTLQDPWGITLVEAMAAGLPIVTTTVAGASAAVKEAGAGIVLPERSPSELRAALAALLGEPARRRELGERGRAAGGRFGLERHVDLVLAAYEGARREERFVPVPVQAEAA